MPRLMKSRKVLDRPTGRNLLERRLSFPIEVRRIDTLKSRQIASQFSQGFSQLQFRPRLVVLLVMIEADREVNQRLKKQPEWTLRRPPYVLEDFMAFVEFPSVK